MWKEVTTTLPTITIIGLEHEKEKKNHWSSWWRWWYINLCFNHYQGGWSWNFFLSWRWKQWEIWHPNLLYLFFLLAFCQSRMNFWCVSHATAQHTFHEYTCYSDFLFYCLAAVGVVDLIMDQPGFTSAGSYFPHCDFKWLIVKTKPPKHHQNRIKVNDKKQKKRS